MPLENVTMGNPEGRACRRFSASYTVEASYVMAIVILSLAVLIRTAYGQCVEFTGFMRLHYMVEFVRSREAETEKKLSLSGGGGSVQRKDDEVSGTAVGDGWEKEIEASVHEPEKLMRMLTVFDQMIKGDGDDEGSRETGD